MPCDIGYRVTLGQGWHQGCEHRVLGRFECVALQAFKLYADRVIIAVVSPAVMRLTRMPGPIITTDKLQNLATASHIKVAGNLHTFYLAKVGVLRPVELVGEERLYFVAAIHPRRQADGMQHHKINHRRRRAWPEVG